MKDAIVERDWERFDGFTPTFTHPTLSADEPAAAARQCLHAFLRAPVVSGELPAHLHTDAASRGARRSTAASNGGTRGGRRR
jgi:hypothetical protein